MFPSIVASLLGLASTVIAGCGDDTSAGVDGGGTTVVDGGAMGSDGGGLPFDGGSVIVEDDGGSMRDGGGTVDDGGPLRVCVGAIDDADTEAAATLKPPITDCDGTGYSIDGALDGDTDIDWFAIDATDVGGCFVDPVVNTGAAVRVCLFARCIDGTRPETTCVDGALPETSEELNPGCCRRSGGMLEITTNCPGFDEDVQLKISVSDGTVAACTPYTLSVHY